MAITPEKIREKIAALDKKYNKLAISGAQLETTSEFVGNAAIVATVSTGGVLGAKAVMTEEGVTDKDLATAAGIVGSLLATKLAVVGLQKLNRAQLKSSSKKINELEAQLRASAGGN